MRTLHTQHRGHLVLNYPALVLSYGTAYCLCPKDVLFSAPSSTPSENLKLRQFAMVEYLQGICRISNGISIAKRRTR